MAFCGGEMEWRHSADDFICHTFGMEFIWLFTARFESAIMHYYEN